LDLRTVGLTVSASSMEARWVADTDLDIYRIHWWRITSLEEMACVNDMPSPICQRPLPRTDFSTRNPLTRLIRGHLGINKYRNWFYFYDSL